MLFIKNSNPLTIGRKSIIRELTIPNHNQIVSPFAVRIQANKNFGICDLVLGTWGRNSTAKSTKKVFIPTRRLNEFLNDFQGRQINDSYVIEHLKNVLSETLNKVEE